MSISGQVISLDDPDLRFPGAAAGADSVWLSCGCSSPRHCNRARLLEMQAGACLGGEGEREGGRDVSGLLVTTAPAPPG